MLIVFCEGAQPADWYWIGSVYWPRFRVSSRAVCILMPSQSTEFVPCGTQKVSSAFPGHCVVNRSSRVDWLVLGRGELGSLRVRGDRAELRDRGERTLGTELVGRANCGVNARTASLDFSNGRGDLQRWPAGRGGTNSQSPSATLVGESTVLIRSASMQCKTHLLAPKKQKRPPQRGSNCFRLAEREVRPCEHQRPR